MREWSGLRSAWPQRLEKETYQCPCLRHFRAVEDALGCPFVIGREGNPHMTIVEDGVIGDEGGRRAAAVYTLIETCKLNDVDPQARLADILARLPDHTVKQIDELLPWTWNKARQLALAAAA